jgi:selenocysteine-specific elongation factor
MQNTDIDIKNVNPSRILNLNVGVLGHVDSGKTSLVKTLSTLLSTASLDKSSQSRQRGITLDLGFSAFLMPLPPAVKSQEELAKNYDLLQVTLVDCPGHASLIRTIIGGAQIIDMVLLVVDATKGIQTQTAECLVIAEMTTRNLIVVLNKIDLFSDLERSQKLIQVESKIRSALRNSRFVNSPMVGVSACVGGEKVAAMGKDVGHIANVPQTMNVNGLIDLLHEKIQPPKRDQISKDHFHFAVDHCFPIKGKGTVITGTCLSGSIKVNDTIEFPTLSLQRKVKSMQMFRRDVSEVKQGDRAGLCVANLDSKLMERGIAASVDSVKLITGAIAVVKKVRYFRQTLNSGSKFHISVGHTTVMGTVTFFGAQELSERLKHSGNGCGSNDSVKSPHDLEHQSGLGDNADVAGLPRLTFDFEKDFLQQDGYIEKLEDENITGNNVEDIPLQWAIIDFQTPVYCPVNSLIIGSRLDTDVQANTCRLAFSGRLIEKFDAGKDMHRIRFYTRKERAGTVDRLGDPFKRNDDGKVVRYEVYGCDLFRKETNMNDFVGLHLETERGDIGVIQSSFGTSGKFRMHFPSGTTVRNGEKLFLRFKRYANDPDKKICQDSVLPPVRPGTRIEAESKKDKKKKGGNEYNKPLQNLKLSQDPTQGKISNTKGEPMANGLYEVMIVEGFFTPEIDIRQKVGMKVQVKGTSIEGIIVGSFGKAGKCKVEFPGGISKEMVGSDVLLFDK